MSMVSTKKHNYGHYKQEKTRTKSKCAFTKKSTRKEFVQDSCTSMFIAAQQPKGGTTGTYQQMNG